MKNALIAMAAMMGLGAGTSAATYRHNPYMGLPSIKYSPRALPKGRSGDKLRRKAREGKLGIAVLK